MPLIRRSGIGEMLKTAGSCFLFVFGASESHDTVASGQWIDKRKQDTLSTDDMLRTLYDGD